ncbi:MAG: methyltransferase domain-containing protein, partial [Planctomycetes bacterium]|nr:methyltransferase domain-containing protein [Planctomycetota bacterium]
PYMVALMTSLVAPLPGDKILEIGTGSGYQAAILAELAREVHTVERHEELSAEARAVLGELGYANIHFHVGDGSVGWPDAAPYDGILVTAGSPQVPPSLRRQLADGGRLVIPVGPFREQRLHVVTRQGNLYEDIPSCPCVFVKLYGAEGWTTQEPG